MRIDAITVSVISMVMSADIAMAVVPVRLIIAEGQALPGTNGRICVRVNAPFTNGLGEIGFTGSSDAGDFVWINNGVAWYSPTSGTPRFVGIESSMGSSNSGHFVYGPMTTQGRSIWTDSGNLLSDQSPIPHMPGKFSGGNFYPRMTDVGSVIWGVTICNSRTGPITNHGYFRVANPSAPVFETLILGGNVYGGLTTAPLANPTSTFDISSNGEHRIHKLSTTESTLVGEFMYLSSSDSIVARQGFAIVGSTGEIWMTFRTTGINNAGNWVIAGDTNISTINDEIVVYKNTVIARENQTFGAHRLGGTVGALSINNRNRIGFVFGSSGPSIGSVMLVAGPATNFRTRARELLFNGSELDVNNDGLCDYVIGAFEASYPGSSLDIGDDGMIYVQVSMAPCIGGPAVRAIIGVRDICLADFNSDYQVNFLDLHDFVDAFSANIPAADFNLDGNLDFFDYLDYADAYSSGC